MRAQMFHREMQAKKQPMSAAEKSELLSLGFRNFCNFLAVLSQNSPN